MPLTNPDVPITKKDLSDFYQAILPYLGGSAENLNDLLNVVISNVADGEILQYDSTSGKWINVSNAGGVQIDDTTTSTTETWSSNKINTELGNKQGILTTSNGIDITNGTITAKIDGDTITFNAQGQMIASVGASSLNDLTNVNITTPIDGQVLKYNQTTSKWENQVDAGGAIIDDTTTSSSTVWSSSKVNTEITSKTEIDDTSTTVSNTWSASKISNVIAALALVDFSVVQTLPIQDISTHTIYLVPKSTAQTDDVYDEYIYINNDWEHIGSTTVDLSNYYTKTEADTLFDDKQDVLTAGDGIEIEAIGNSTIIKSTGAIIYANPLFPSNI